MTPADLYRSQRPKSVDAARDAATADYAERFDALAERATTYREAGSYLADDAAHAADLAWRASTAEFNDPEPRANLRDGYCCLPCHVWYIAAAQNRVGR